MRWASDKGLQYRIEETNSLSIYGTGGLGCLQAIMRGLLGEGESTEGRGGEGKRAHPEGIGAGLPGSCGMRDGLRQYVPILGLHPLPR